MKLVNKLQQRKNQGGFSLLELAIVIGVIALLILIIVATASSVGSSRKASAEVQAVTTIIQNAKTFKTGGSYGPAGTNLVTTLINANQVPGAINVAGTTLTNQWAGAITIVGNLGSLVLTDTTVPPDACVAEVTGVANGDSTLTVTVGGTAVARTNGVIGSAAASTACGTTGGTLVFTTSS